METRVVWYEQTERRKDTASEEVSDYNEKKGYQSPYEYAVDTFTEVFELVQAKDFQAIIGCRF